MVFIDGFLTGLILQIAIGPVFFYILNLALTQSLLDAYAAISATVLVDYLYISLAILGVGQTLEKRRIKTILGLLGAVVLIFFGWLMILDTGQSGIGPQVSSGLSNPIASFLSTFLLAISSPLTIVFWTGVFASKGVEKDYTGNKLIIFGIAAGLATLVFLGISITASYYLQFSLPGDLIRYLNSVVGVILILYGVVRFGKLIQEMIKKDLV
jgi:threonine/homoserine/homoserine lactone efflux protein